MKLVAVSKIQLQTGFMWLESLCRFRFEFEELACLVGSGGSGVTFSTSPQSPSLTIISNPSASNSYKWCLVTKVFEFATPFDSHT